jgi:thioredoxin reductase
LATQREQRQYVIVGAGPAGLQLSYFLDRAGADYLTLERGAGPSQFFRQYPRHRKLISLNKVHTTSSDPEIRLRWDWNSLLNDSPELLFPQFSQAYFPDADVLTHYLEEFDRHYQLRISYDTTVERIERTDDGFVLRLARVGESSADDTADVLYARCVIIATGWGHPHIPEIKGIEYATGYEDMSVDPVDYAGQRVLVIGKGNSGFETASALLGHAAMVHLASRRPIRLAWNTKHPGDVRGQYAAILDSYQFKTLHSVLDCTIDEIRPVGDRFEVHITYSHADGETEVLEYESVLRCTGFRMATAVFGDGCAVATTLDGRLPALRSDFQSTTVDGLYFAGTLAQSRDFKRASSAFIDGFRYNLRTMAALLRERYEGVPVPCVAGPADPHHLTQLVLDRVNRSSALWTQFEYLCDVLVVDEATGMVRHYEDLPEDYAVERFADQNHYYTYGLRWGRDDHPDVFAIDRHPQPGRARESAFIHPVIRRYSGSDMVAEQHLLEDLLAHWRRPDRHVAPTLEFFTRHLSGT